MRAGDWWRAKEERWRLGRGTASCLDLYTCIPTPPCNRFNILNWANPVGDAEDKEGSLLNSRSLNILSSIFCAGYSRFSVKDAISRSDTKALSDFTSHPDNCDKGIFCQKQRDYEFRDVD